MLTPKEIRALKPQSRRYQITDSPGLALRVQVSGVKSWVFRFFRNGRVTDQTIGHWPEISLIQARAIVRRKQKELEIEPTGSFTVRDAFRFWCTKKKGKILSYRDERLRLEKYVISKIGSRQLDSITPPMIIRLMEPLEEEGKASTIKRLLMRTREIFDMTVNAGLSCLKPFIQNNQSFSSPGGHPHAGRGLERIACRPLTD